jgi:rhodanese-related sulfurtransferase
MTRGEDVFLLDVREPDEVTEWAYPIGINIPLGQLGDRMGELPDRVGTTIVVACHAGSRSAAAAAALSEAGWTAENLTGGAIAWAATETEG